MNNGLYTSASALILNQKKMDVISNNLANINTTGFKKDIVLSEAFPEVLLSKINDGIDIENQKPFNGIEIKQEGDVFNLRVDTGYFKVKTPAGMGHTRELQFTINEEGYLKTFYKDKNDNLKTDGENYVMGKNGPIKIEGGNLDIDQKGNVLSNGQVIDNLITFPHPSVIGTSSAGVRLDKLATNFIQGNLMETGNSLDFALDGEGFFKIYRDGEAMYTRDGSFTLNQNGELVTTEGDYVLGQYGSIMVEGEFTITPKGEIIQEGEVVDQILLVNIENSQDLRKEGNNLYAMVEDVEATEAPFEGEVLRGYLENSNVNAIREMVEMITLLRNYEASQKFIKNQDELLGKAVNDIGRV